MFEIKIFITPLLIFRINIVAKLGARCSRGSVPMNSVLFETVVRGQVKPTAKPPYWLATFFMGSKKPDIHVSCGDKRVIGVNDQRDT